ncbi:Flp pilus assembly protein CpaB [Variovorax boronicumulans]|uniref:Flp pilus assembly protein CpaB n=1 Tax=Variovorax boronicumulans TaxID=436515 RepID=UPI0012E545F3|nr:Flp pilus assembly protein CpaB [Variovorax boronicumulans]GER17795.1 Flp pilus assembly protein CpaB [Variovorax boronicumulans]
MINLTKIIAAILVLLALALGGYAWMLGRQAPPKTAVTAAPISDQAKGQQANTYPVVVATKPLPAGQVIAADALRVEQLTVNPAGAFQDAAAAVGRVPVLDLSEGTPVMENQLVSGLALRVGEGERAVAIKADEIMGVGNKIQPGDLVDVFITLKSDGKDVDRSQARLLLSRKRVLAFGSSSVDGLPSKTADKQQQQQQVQRTEAARTAVLAVPVDDVNRLTIGDATGRLMLALRNPNDMAEPDPKLFADLPTALQPASIRPGEPRRPPLEGLDRAQAGLTAVDLVTGGKSIAARPALTEARTISAGARTAQPSTARGGLQVEVIRGDRSETTSY